MRRVAAVALGVGARGDPGGLTVAPRPGPYGPSRMAGRGAGQLGAAAAARCRDGLTPAHTPHPGGWRSGRDRAPAAARALGQLGAATATEI
jgi:hypothetical protein